MNEPTPRTSRLALAAGALSLLIVGGTGFVAGRDWVRPEPVPNQPSTAPPPTASLPAAAMAEPERLDRAALLGLVAAAADAAASGRPPPGKVAQAGGGRFSIALPFGCTGPLGDADTAATGWRYDEGTNALRLQVAPTRWSPQDWSDDAPSGDIEAVEGFWVPRPWTSLETCPAGNVSAAAAGTEPVTLAGQTLAIGQEFHTGGARQDRRDGQPYVAVVRSTPEAAQAGSGFRLRLTGQLADGPDGGPVRCRQPGGPDQRPICLLRATFDEVAVENIASGETLARWPAASGRGK